MKELTPIQSQLVADNHNLIYEYAKKHNLNLEDYYDILALALCKAAREHNNSIAKFSTFSWNVMQNEMINYWKSQSAKKKIPEDKILSSDAPLDSDSEGTFADTFTNEYSLEDDIVSNEQCKFLLSLLNDKEKKVAEYLSEGLTQEQIANKIGCSGRNVRYIKIQIQKKLSSYYNY